MLITFPSKPKIVYQEGNKAIFEIDGCYPGYGITLGNALRRTLLSSLSGAAITGVKIKGVQHEFSTIPYVLENVIDIILNLKQIRIKLFTDQPVKVILKAKGEREVKGGDIQTTPEIEIVNKDAHIATLTDKKAELEMELEIRRGLGYEPVELQKKGHLEIGKIAIDAIYSPVKRVNFEVDNMRVGDRTDYNRLRLEIETDGTISPVEALEKASAILVEHFKIIGDLKGEREEKKKTEKEEKPEKTKKEIEPSKIKIEELKLSTRTISSLTDGGIRTVAGLIRKSVDDLKEIKGLGDKGIAEIKKVLKNFDLSLKE